MIYYYIDHVSFSFRVFREGKNVITGKVSVCFISFSFSFRLILFEGIIHIYKNVLSTMNY